MNFFDDLFIIESINDTETGFSAKLRCNPSHPVYQAHFPGNPITPGACLLNEAGVVLQKKMGRPLYLKSSKNIKYFSVVVPEEGKEVHYDFSRLVVDDNECKAQVTIADDTTVYTKMSLTYGYEPL